MIRSFNTIILLLTFVSSANAAFNGLSIHSRASCINNESITWDARWYRTYKTVSHHEKLLENGEEEKDTESHIIETGQQDTWRSAAVHWGEGRGWWRVVGFHFIYKNGKEKYLGPTDVSDCSIYNGWWDTSEPKGNNNT